MTIIYNTRNSEDQINRIYNDYDLAYIGERFSESFKEWNYRFYRNMHPILNGVFTSITTHGALVYVYNECTITYTIYTLRGNITAIVIHDYNFNQDDLEDVRAETRIERIRHGMGSYTATTTPSAMRTSDYIEVGEKDYGTLFGDKVVLLKKKGRRKRQLFNYMCYPKSGSAPYIMYNQDFYSAFPFEDNIAYAWGTDGHKYKLGTGGRMVMVESRKSLDSIITEVINCYLRENLLPA